MRFGLLHFATEYSIQPADLGRLAEEMGFDTVLLPEHTHIPLSRETPYPGGGDIPREYLNTYDPFVALATMAAATERLRVGTGICLINQRDPITTAKEVASLDRLSGGRFVFGVGAGWNVDEMRNHGTASRGRFELMAQRIGAMKEIWTREEAEYHGSRVDFDPLWSWPKPSQRPHPPIVVGGEGEKVLDRVVAYGDAWLPNRLAEVEELEERIQLLQQKAEAAGRDPIPVWGFNAPNDEEHLRKLEAAGVERVFFAVPSDSAKVGRATILDRAGLVERMG